MAGLGAQQPGRALLLGHEPHFPPPEVKATPKPAPRARSPDRVGLPGRRPVTLVWIPAAPGPGPRCAGERRAERVLVPAMVSARGGQARAVRSAPHAGGTPGPGHPAGAASERMGKLPSGQRSPQMGPLPNSASGRFSRAHECDGGDGGHARDPDGHSGQPRGLRRRQ